MRTVTSHRLPLDYSLSALRRHCRAVKKALMFGGRERRAAAVRLVFRSF